METTDTLGRKLELILAKLEEHDRLLKRLVELSEEDTPTREFLLNLAADLTGNLISGK